MTHFLSKAVRSAALAGLLLVSAGCATSTPYQPFSDRADAYGGYTDERLESGHYRVTFAGNMLTTRQRVEDYLLFRAAELTTQEGYDWFVVIDKEMDHEIERQVRTEPHSPIWYGSANGDWRPYWRYQDIGTGWREWDPYHGDRFWTEDVDVATVERFEATAEIRLGRGAIPAGEESAIMARSVIAEIGPRVEYPQG